MLNRKKNMCCSFLKILFSFLGCAERNLTEKPDKIQATEDKHIESQPEANTIDETNESDLEKELCDGVIRDAAISLKNILGLVINTNLLVGCTKRTQITFCVGLYKPEIAIRPFKYVYYSKLDKRSVSSKLKHHKIVNGVKDGRITKTNICTFSRVDNSSSLDPFVSKMMVYYYGKNFLIDTYLNDIE